MIPLSEHTQSLGVPNTVLCRILGSRKDLVGEAECLQLRQYSKRLPVGRAYFSMRSRERVQVFVCAQAYVCACTLLYSQVSLGVHVHACV